MHGEERREGRDRLLVDRLVRLDGHVAAGEAGAAGRDDGVDRRDRRSRRAAAPRSPPARRGRSPGRPARARPRQPLDQQVARAVLRRPAGVRDRQHRDPDRQEGAAASIPPSASLEPRLQQQQVGPGLALLAPVAQQRRRVEGRDRRHAAPVVPAAAQPGDALARCRAPPAPPASRAAAAPRAPASSMWRKRNGSSIATSSPEGSRFCGGRQGSTLVM